MKCQALHNIHYLLQNAPQKQQSFECNIENIFTTQRVALIFNGRSAFSIFLDDNVKDVREVEFIF